VGNRRKRVPEMNKLAVFVEGYTEAVFAEKLVEEIAGKNKVLIEQRKIYGGSTTKRRMRLVKVARPDAGQKYFVLIFDCGGDEQVKTRIREEHDNLTRNGYLKIIGIRDVRPNFTHAEIPKLEANLPKYVKTSLIPVEFILAIMEIEAWFLAEATHFPTIDPSITVQAIKVTLGFDPENDDMEQRTFPSNDLNNCYSIGGKSYLKHNAKDTVDALDFTLIYMELCNKFRYLKRLIVSIDAFLS
jgi:hypothetical protein